MNFRVEKLEKLQKNNSVFYKGITSINEKFCEIIVKWKGVFL